MDDSLTALAEAAGLKPRWTDARGEARTVPPRTLRISLNALGFPADTDSNIAESRHRLAQQNRKAPPMVIARAGRRLALGLARHAVVHFEDGTTAAVNLAFAEDGTASMHVPAIPGYHRIEIDGGMRAFTIAPPRCFTIADTAPGRKLAGLAVQLYSLRGGHSAGFGDLAALSAMAAPAAARGIDAIAVSPLHALFLSAPDAISPYSPSTRLFFDPLYADAALAGGAVAKDDGIDGLIDWPRAAREKLAMLRNAFSRFRERPAPEDFVAFQAQQGARLIGHARFETLDSHFRALGLGHWKAWPEAFRNPASAEVVAFARDHKDTVDFHIFLQWLTAKSLAAAQTAARDAGMAVGIIADIAVGMNPAGSHAWSAPGEILTNLSIGAPPDLFNPQGQDWGLTAISPTALRETGYAPFIDTLRANMRYAGGVRVDHIMGLCRLWLLPQGAGPEEGVYLHYPMDDLLNLVALESSRHRTVIIGENLGTVPEGFGDALARTGIMGMEVLWFQRDANGFFPADRWTAQSAAMTTTHDLPTLAGWWRGRDIEWLEKLGRKSSHGDAAAEIAGRADDRKLLWSALAEADCATGAPPAAEDTAPVIEAALGFVGATPSDLAIVPMEDVLGIIEQPNIPGTIDEHPNWRRRLPPGDAFAAPQTLTNLARLQRARRRS